MARAQIETLLSLDEWANILTINPWEFNTCIGGLPAIMLRGCESVFHPFSYQVDFVAWDAIAQAIEQAESMVSEVVGYYFAPKQFTGEIAAYPQGARSGFQAGLVWSKNGQYKPVRMEWAKIQAIGSYTESLVEAGVTVTYSDENGDGVIDTFTLTVTVAENTSPGSIIAYVPVSEWTYPQSRTQYWQIRPVNVSVSGTTATITGHAAQLAKPSLQEDYDLDKSAIDISNAANRLATLDIYLQSVDTDSAITAYWNQDVYGNGTVSTTLNEAITVPSQEWDRGFIRPSFNGCSTYVNRGAPQSLKVNYIAGVPRVNGRIDPRLARIITYLSVALLNEETCGCERSDRIIRRWRMFPNEGQDKRPMTPSEIDANPFGARNGMRYAWQQIQRLIREGGAYV